ncbi:hypothetical protein HZS61_016364 [Fusarium oxysporum f. sp. conglutinans]|uniref:Uncharacterized protein n=1 Tax=Fusarium oxysporum f. sp. conglutinans TaxID=100902 RepID=A0A8H6LGN8_FUSOX|nr:hypothetical protein HZS61_016364 [Fusarium oxysporum f. sp. conglutinans]
MQSLSAPVRSATLVLY